MGRRAIPRELVEETLAAPQQIVSAPENTKAYQSQVEFGGTVYLLRVIVDEARNPATVITVYRTSRIRKYWRAP
jgi:hypothetical protein